MSNVWNYFTKSDITGRVHCNICDYSAKTARGSTSNYWQHVRAKHPEHYDYKRQLNTSPNAELCPSTSVSSIKQIKLESMAVCGTVETPKAKLKILPKNLLSKSKAEEITKTITMMLCQDLLPLTFIEGTGFKNFLNCLAPNYQIPEKHAIQTRLDTMHTTEKEQLKTTLKNVKHVSLAIDCWTSSNLESYITVNIFYISKQWEHKTFNLSTHRAVNLKNTLQDICNEWDLSEAGSKIVATLHDNSIKLPLTEQFGEHVDCFSHNLQEIISKALELRCLEELLRKCSKLVSYLKHSYGHSLKIQSEALVQSIESNWMSTYYMLQKLLEQREAVTAVFSDKMLIGIVTSKNKTMPSQLVLSKSEWLTIEQLIEILRPFQLSTVILSSELHPNLSLVFPVIKSVYNEINKRETTQVDFKETLLDELQATFKWLNAENEDEFVCTLDIYDFVTFVDPRYKNHEKESGSIFHLKTLFAELIEEERGKSQMPGAKGSTPSPSVIKNEMTAIELLFQEYNASDESNSSVDEVELYSLEPPIAKTANPLNWWKMNEYRFPYLSRIAAKYLAIPAIAASSDRAFSVDGSEYNAKRSCLKGDSANKLIYLNQLLK